MANVTTKLPGGPPSRSGVRTFPAGLASPGGARLVVAVAFGLAAVGLFGYVRRSFANVVFRDGMQLLPTVGDFYAGTLTLGKFFIPYSEHLLPFYRLLLVFSSAVFGLNMFVDPVLMACGSLATGWILYLAFRSSMAEMLGPGGVALAFLPVLAACVSLAYPPQVFMAVQFQMASILALLVGFLLYGRGDGERGCGRLAAAGGLVGSYFALFAGGYFPGLVAAMLAVLALRFVLRRRAPSCGEWALLTSILASAAWYARTLLHGSLAGQRPSQKLLAVVMQPGQTARFFLRGLSASLMDLHSFEGLSPRVAEIAELSLGGLVLGSCLLSLWLFHRSEMGRRTYLPVWLLAYPFGIMAAVCVGRSGLGDSGWMMNEWYSFHLKFIPVSVVWILIFAALARQQVPGALKSAGRAPVGLEGIIALAFLVVFASTWGYSNRSQWDRGPHVKRWFEVRRTAMLHPETLTEPIENVLLVSREEAIVGMRILARNHLNVFRDPEVMKPPTGTRVGSPGRRQ